MGNDPTKSQRLHQIFPNYTILTDLCLDPSNKYQLIFVQPSNSLNTHNTSTNEILAIKQSLYQNKTHPLNSNQSITQLIQCKKIDQMYYSLYRYPTLNIQKYVTQYPQNINQSFVLYVLGIAVRNYCILSKYVQDNNGNVNKDGLNIDICQQSIRILRKSNNNRQVLVKILSPYITTHSYSNTNNINNRTVNRKVTYRNSIHDLGTVLYRLYTKYQRQIGSQVINFIGNKMIKNYSTQSKAWENLQQQLKQFTQSMNKNNSNRNIILMNDQNKIINNNNQYQSRTPQKQTQYVTAVLPQKLNNNNNVNNININSKPLSPSPSDLHISTVSTNSYKNYQHRLSADVLTTTNNTNNNTINTTNNTYNGSNSRTHSPAISRVIYDSEQPQYQQQNRNVSPYNNKVNLQYQSNQPQLQSQQANPNINVNIRARQHSPLPSHYHIQQHQQPIPVTLHQNYQTQSNTNINKYTNNINNNNTNNLINNNRSPSPMRYYHSNTNINTNSNTNTNTNTNSNNNQLKKINQNTNYNTVHVNNFDIKYTQSKYKYNNNNNNNNNVQVVTPVLVVPATSTVLTKVQKQNYQVLSSANNCNSSSSNTVRQQQYISNKPITTITTTINTKQQSNSNNNNNSNTLQIPTATATSVLTSPLFPSSLLLQKQQQIHESQLITIISTSNQCPIYKLFQPSPRDPLQIRPRNGVPVLNYTVKTYKDCPQQIQEKQNIIINQIKENNNNQYGQFQCQEYVHIGNNNHNNKDNNNRLSFSSLLNSHNDQNNFIQKHLLLGTNNHNVVNKDSKMIKINARELLGSSIPKMSLQKSSFGLTLSQDSQGPNHNNFVNNLANRNINNNNNKVDNINILQNLQQYQQQQNKGQYQGSYHPSHPNLKIKHGLGKLTFPSGGSYQGGFNFNKMDGWGKLFYPSGRLAYEGYWKQDKFQGYGKLFNQCPKHIQVFDYRDFNQVQQQQQQMQQQDGNNGDGYWKYYQGNMKNDMKQGHGIWVLENGQKYDGDFYHDMVHGIGTFYGKKDIIQGQWDHNVLVRVIRKL